jgi:predicted phage tail protein
MKQSTTLRIIPMIAPNRLRKIYLSGRLGKRFGKVFTLAVETPAEAVRALSVLCKGFRQAMREGDYRVQRIGKSKTDLPLIGLHMFIGDADIRIVPVMAGAKNSGGWLILAGVAIMAAAIFFAPAALAGASSLFGANMGAAAFSIGGLATVSYGTIASIGLMVALVGVSALLSPKPQDPISTVQGNTFAALANVSAQGVPVPLLYGTSLEGSIIISAGMFSLQTTPGVPPPESPSTLVVGA